MAIEATSASYPPLCPIDLFDPAFVRDPHPGFRFLRDTAPVSWNTAGFWLVVRHDDVVDLLRDPRFDHWGQDTGVVRSPMEAALAQVLHLLSPRAALPLRHPIATGLAATFDCASADAAHHADSLLRALQLRREIELMADYAHPFTFGVIAAILGVPSRDVASLSALVAALDGEFLSCLAPETLAPGPHDAAVQVVSYLADLIALKRRESGDDLLTRLICGGNIPEEQIVPLLVLLFYAGHQNMMNFIGNALVALTRFPSCLAAARESPELLRRGVNELLRYDSPVLYIALVARETIRLRRCTIEPGAVVFAGVSAANRDPQVFHDPDKLDFSRASSGQLAFGYGAFRCLGARLAELEGAIALSRFLAHVSDFHVEEEAISWRSSPVVQRGPVAVPIEVRTYARGES